MIRGERLGVEGPHQFPHGPVKEDTPRAIRGRGLPHPAVRGIIAVILTARTGHLHHPVLNIINESRAGHGRQVAVVIIRVAGTVDAVVGRIDAERHGRPRALGHRLVGPVAEAIIGESQSPVGPRGAGGRQLAKRVVGVIDRHPRDGILLAGDLAVVLRSRVDVSPV